MKPFGSRHLTGMTSLLARSRRSHVGGWLYRRVPLRSNERVILEDRCQYLLPVWGWRLGKLFVTNQRIIWSPSWDLPQIFFQPRTIALSQITRVDVVKHAFPIKMPGQWRIDAGSKSHYFSDGWGPFPPAMSRDKWIVGIKELIGALNPGA